MTFAATPADPAVRAAYVEDWGGELLPLRGTSSEALVAEMEAAALSDHRVSLARTVAGFLDRRL